MTMQPPKVLILELQERTSAAGNTYLSGWTCKARLVGFGLMARTAAARRVGYCGSTTRNLESGLPRPCRLHQAPRSFTLIRPVLLSVRDHRQ